MMKQQSIGGGCYVCVGWKYYDCRYVCLKLSVLHSMRFSFPLKLSLFLTTTCSKGQLAGFCMFAGHLAESTLEISESVGGCLRAQGSGARLFFLLDKGPFELDGAGDTTIETVAAGKLLPASYKADIQFDGVDFYYPSHTQQALVLDNLSFKLRDGEMLAVSGSSGSGKSSIVALLMRFYAPSSGVITLGGKGKVLSRRIIYCMCCIV